MGEAIQHLSRYRVGSTTLQVIADASEWLEALIEAEKRVIDGFSRRGLWAQQRVTLFVLDDLQALVFQIRHYSGLAGPEAEELGRRPMVNVYKMADRRACTVFVNRRAMSESGFWGDPLAVTGLLAHEHAHPLAECATARATRRLRPGLRVDGWSGGSVPGPRAGGKSDPRLAAQGVLHLLGDKLFLHGPQEVLSNDLAVRAGFEEALVYLDRRSIAGTAASMAQRPVLLARLAKQVAEGRLSHEDIAALALIGDLQAGLALALEIAPFLRADRTAAGEALEAELERDLLAGVDPAVGRVYRQLRDRYLALSSDLDPDGLRRWCASAGRPLVEALRAKGLRASLEFGSSGAAGEQAVGAVHKRPDSLAKQG